MADEAKEKDFTTAEVLDRLRRGLGLPAGWGYNKRLDPPVFKLTDANRKKAEAATPTLAKQNAALQG